MLQNSPHLQLSLVNDPFGVAEKLTLLPVTNFWQAYHLMTSGLEITTGDYEDLDKNVDAALERVRTAIAGKLHMDYTPHSNGTGPSDVRASNSLA